MSIPVNLSSPEDEGLAALEEKGVKGRYASAERILELPGDKVEWRMAVSSSAGGLVPQFIADFALPETVSRVWLISLVRPFTADDVSTLPGCTVVSEVDAGEQGWGRWGTIRIGLSALQEYLISFFIAQKARASPHDRK